MAPDRSASDPSAVSPVEVNDKVNGDANEAVAIDSPEKDDQAENGAPTAAASATQAPEIKYPGFWLSALITFALLLALFLVALDISIISTAIPTITAEFHSIDQIGWYGSAFFLGLATFQAFWGKAYKFFPLKIVFLSCVGVFEIGTLIAALAPNSIALIVARAIQGLGGAGVTGGCFIILGFTIHPRRVPLVLGLTSSVWSVSSVLGPVLGGVFTQYVTWRWCFWINLPIGGTTILLLLLCFKTPAHSRVAHTTTKEAPFLFDVPGMAILIGTLVAILLVLQDGGVTKPWNDQVVIGLIVGFGALSILLGAVEWFQGERAMVVPRIMKRRTIWVLALFNLTAQGSGFARTYNLPIYFQAVQGVSASQSGIRTLPTVLTTSIFSFLGSIAVSRIGYYKIFLIVGSIFLTIGSGLIYTLEPDSGPGKYVGYQVFTAVGSGLVIQLNVIVAQALTPRSDVAVATAIVLFWQFIGGTLGVSTAENIMNNYIVQSLPTDNPNVTAAKVLATGANDLRTAFQDPADLAIVVNAYVRGLKAAWIFGTILTGLCFLVALCAEWRSIKPEDVKKEAEKKAAAEADSV
ncbi:putative MFS transporter [Xylariaceae sp. FL1651]|nr:putative MFS transporter [Xylariaceae sp. FL1651]